MHEWLLLSYRIPREPSTGRVSVWRKLKRLGAVAMQDAVWILPKAAWPSDQLRWIAAEIIELGGEATVWEARLAHGDEDELVRKFSAQVGAEYETILKGLQQRDANLSELSSRFQNIQQRDYFGSELGKRLRGALLKAGEASEI